MNKNNCTFTSNIADGLECSQDGEFDSNGFAINECRYFPCEKFVELKYKTSGKRIKVKKIKSKYEMIQV